MLDEQLLRDIDRTLSQTNIHTPQQHRLSTSPPILPTTTIPPPQPARFPPAPPQLPNFNLGGLDLIGTKPDQQRQYPYSASPTSIPQTPLLPNWCPNLPSLDLKNMKWGDFPLFFDLSKLPEPTEPFELEPRCRDVPFFLPMTPSAVELPATACKLHAIDECIQDTQPAKPKTLAEPVEQVVTAAETAAKARHDEQTEATAANLWRILTAPANQFYADDNGLYQPNFAYKPSHELYAAPDGIFDYRLSAASMPVELDDTQLPYVHANSLTGFANERGSEAWPASEGGVPLVDSAIVMEPVQEPQVGLNELVIDPYTEEGYADALLAVLGLPSLPRSPELNPTSSAISDTPPHEPPKFDVPCKNLTQAPTSPSDDNIIDIMTFLSTSHTMHCWCNECAEPPELVTAESLIEDVGWMVYSAAGATTPSTTSPAWEQEWGTFIGDGDIEVSRRPCSSQSGWDEVYPCTPSSLAHGAW